MKNKQGKIPGGKVDKPQGYFTKYVTRYRRTKNLVKKCAEIANQCDLEIILIMHDKKNNKVREVHTSKQMTLTHLNKLLDNGTTNKKIKHERKFVSYEQIEELSTEEDVNISHSDIEQGIVTTASIMD